VVDNPTLTLYNLSLGEKYYKDPEAEENVLFAWKETIRDTKYRGILFVIAAGNEHAPVTQHMLAESGELSNVIVVGASDLGNPPPFHFWLDPDQRHGTNYSDKWVNIIAPGTNILSATWDGKYGTFSGTSQATALVSGAASLLQALHKHWSPWMIKERLVSTSDLETWMEVPNYVQGGMLDIDRALTGAERTVIKFHGEDKYLICDLDSDDLKNRMHVQISSDDGRDIAFQDLRRVHRRTADEHSFTIMYSYRDPNHLHDPDDGRRLVRTPPINQDQISFSRVRVRNCGSKTELDVTQTDEIFNGFQQ